MVKRNAKRDGAQGEGVRARLFNDLVYSFLKPWLVELNQQLDRRLVGTALGVILALVTHRHRNHGLLLSELGGYLLSPQQAVAGTKRLGRLLHAPGWSGATVDRFLDAHAAARLGQLEDQADVALAIWDQSVLEKPESIALDGLGPVRSTKAVRLKRIRPGFYNPPGGRPIMVPGLQWLQVLVAGMRGAPTLARQVWWTTRGERASDRRTVEQQLLRELSAAWGLRVWHIWDRGFAGRPWLTAAFYCGVRFVLRWPKHYQLVDETGQRRPAWHLTRGKRSWEHRLVWDARRRCERKVGIIAVPVQDDEHGQDLWLVVARPGAGREPWYLLTTQPIRSAADAWRVVFAYSRRWQIEMALRFQKCELAFESLRLVAWQTRAKLLGLASLAYAFLLTLLHPDYQSLTRWLLDAFCPRNGKRSRDTQAPLYRLRSALSRLWLTHPPPALTSLTSG